MQAHSCDGHYAVGRLHRLWRERTLRSERDQYPSALLATAVVSVGFWYSEYLSCLDVRVGLGSLDGPQEGTL